MTKPLADHRLVLLGAAFHMSQSMPVDFEGSHQSTLDSVLCERRVRRAGFRHLAPDPAYPKGMVNTQDWHYQFDLPESEECQSLEDFKQMITDFAEQGWEFAGAVTLKVDGGSPREHTVWKQPSSQ